MLPEKSVKRMLFYEVMKPVARCSQTKRKEWKKNVARMPRNWKCNVIKQNSEDKTKGSLQKRDKSEKLEMQCNQAEQRR